MQSNNTHQAKQYRRGARGQSLIETAISLSVLLLIFSGAVDLGRAFYSWVQLNNAVSEGAHWAATYPGCIGTGSTSYADSYTSGPTNCQQSNSIGERILNEEGTLNRSDIVCVLATPNDAAQGSTIQIKAKIGVTMLTPIIRAMFGSTLYLYAQSQEVVRGTAGAVPSTTPVTVSGTSPQGGLSTGCTIP
jgi:Flp pilus assembly protein TadG